MSPRILARLRLLSLAASITLLGTAPFALARQVRDEESETVTFQRAAWSAGDRIESRETTARAIDFEALVDGDVAGKFSQKGTEKVVKRIEILAVLEGEPVKIRVHYDEHGETNEGSDEGEGESREESPLEGKSFVLECRDGAVVVQDDEGGTVDEEVERLIRDEEATKAGRLDVGIEEIEALVAERPRRIGERIEVPEELAWEMFGKEKPPEKIALSLELSEVREIDGVACGVFKTKVELESTEDDFDIEMDLEGETWIGVETARFQGAELSGLFRVTGEVSAEQGGVELRGEGTIEMSSSRAYAPAAPHAPYANDK